MATNTPKHKWAEYPPITIPQKTECPRCGQQTNIDRRHTCPCGEEGCEKCLWYDGTVVEYFCFDYNPSGQPYSECKEDYYKREAMAWAKKADEKIEEYLVEECIANVNVCQAQRAVQEVLNYLQGADVRLEADDENN